MKSLLEILSILGGKVDEDRGRDLSYASRGDSRGVLHDEPKRYLKALLLFAISNFAYSFRNNFLSFFFN